MFQHNQQKKGNPAHMCVFVLGAEATMNHDLYYPHLLLASVFYTAPFFFTLVFGIPGCLFQANPCAVGLSWPQGSLDDQRLCPTSREASAEGPKAGHPSL